MKSIEEALAIRARVLAAFESAAWETDAERRRAWMTLVVAGGGPTGVEMAGALVELLRHVVPRDFPDLDLSGARIVLVEAADRLLATFPPSLQANARAKLAAMGVEVRLGAGVAEVSPESVRLSTGEAIATRTLIWAAGVQAASLATPLPGPRERGGRIPVLPTLELPSHPQVFVIGDLAHCADEKGLALPMLASVACQQGTHAARNILRHARGEPSLPFRYRDWGTMATIGRSAAVAVLAGLKLTGWLAWIAWLGYHLIRLIGFRNRANVLVNWVHNYFTYERGARLILDPGRGPRPPEAAAPRSSDPPR
jgi:NADH dehydrogenase